MITLIPVGLDETPPTARGSPGRSSAAAASWSQKRVGKVLSLGVPGMDFLGSILLSVAGGAAAQAGHSLYGWLKQYLNDTFKDQSDKKIVEALEAIGNLADS